MSTYAFGWWEWDDRTIELVGLDYDGEVPPYEWCPLDGANDNDAEPALFYSQPVEIDDDLPY